MNVYEYITDFRNRDLNSVLDKRFFDNIYEFYSIHKEIEPDDRVLSLCYRSYHPTIKAIVKPDEVNEFSIMINKIVIMPKPIGQIIRIWKDKNLEYEIITNVFEPSNLVYLAESNGRLIISCAEYVRDIINSGELKTCLIEESYFRDDDPKYILENLNNLFQEFVNLFYILKNIFNRQISARELSRIYLLLQHNFKCHCDQTNTLYWLGSFLKEGLKFRDSYKPNIKFPREGIDILEKLMKNSMSELLGCKFKDALREFYISRDLIKNHISEKFGIDKNLLRDEFWDLSSDNVSSNILEFIFHEKL